MINNINIIIYPEDPAYAIVTDIHVRHIYKQHSPAYALRDDLHT